MIDPVSQQIRRLVNRSRLAVLVGSACRWLCWSLLACALGVLIMRGWAGWQGEDLRWALAPLALVPLGVLAEMRLRPSRSLSWQAAAAYLDLWTHSGGLVCSAEAKQASGDVQPWIEQANQGLHGAQLPQVQWSRCVRPVLACAVFLLACNWVPVPQAKAQTASALLEREAEDLREQLETLEEELTLDDQVASELNDSLESIEDELKEAGSEELLEAMDRLAEQMQDEAADAEQWVRQVEESLAERMAGSEHAGGSSDENATEPGANPENMSQLAEMLQELNKRGLMAPLGDEWNELTKNMQLPQGFEGMSEEELAKALEGLALDPEQFAALAEALSAGMRDKLGKLADAGLLGGFTPGALGDAKSLADLAKLSEWEPHVCDENCPKGPGGT